MPAFVMNSRNCARGLALAFTVVMVLALGIQMLFMYMIAILRDANTRPSIWISWGISSFLMAANIGFIITWMVAAATDNLRWMTIGLTGTSVRLVGTVIYIFLSEVKAKLSKWTDSEKAGDIMRRETLFEDVWLFPTGFMLAIEVSPLFQLFSSFAFFFVLIKRTIALLRLHQFVRFSKHRR
ncbi:uncharacterized protein [Dermacentor andersoni]|uniref:uncharacterized protein n=1 Tax=Dermacentor andersoni TaxID=34620 RepID=UPI002415D7CE|nr:uncharacterized protein LOC126517065 [Dermacentor andersoni]